MKIAQISPLYESVPPKLYGGTERVVSYLTEALVDQGHDVTLFASGDSETRAELVAICPEALRLGTCTDPMAHHILQLQEIVERVHEFDVIHFHTDYLHFPMSLHTGATNVTTLHGRLDLPELRPLYRKFPTMPLVSISKSQRQPLPMAGWVDTVYHGLPVSLYRKGEGKGGYVAFIGRISPEKRVDRAIEIAGRAGINIKIAAKIDRADEAYFEEKIRPLFRLPHVEYVGEIGEKEKNDFLGNAAALIFPIDWPEPFGMVMIEAMACGTPVIAYRNGSVPEVIDHGKSGFIVTDMHEAIDALKHIDKLSRKQCREIFEQRFSAARMASDYVKVYERLLHTKGQVVELQPHAYGEKQLYTEEMGTKRA